MASGCGVKVRSADEASAHLAIASSMVYASDGSEMTVLHGEVDRRKVELGDLPAHTHRAVVAIEDQRYWQHSGIDVRGLVRAAASNVLGDGGLQGGSTITQQLAKNLYFPKPERTILRKVTELRYAFSLERRYSKRRILEMYLNTVYFGRGAYGIQAASRAYFRKDARDLTVDQSAFLAGLVHEPGRYDAHGAAGSAATTITERAVARRNAVIDRMLQMRFIDADQARAARAAKLNLASPPEPHWRHPYFVDAVLRELGVLGAGSTLDDRFDALGRTAAERADRVYAGGLRIHTTLDKRAQAAAERTIATELADLPRVSGALVSVEPGTGRIRALVGGNTYYPSGCENGKTSRACSLAKVNLALGRAGGGSGRQPGSSFKPLVLATALASGVSLKETLDGSPFTYVQDGVPWKVRNYEGSRGGRMSVVDATVHSVNAAFARLEIDEIGEGDGAKGAAKVAAVSRKLGIGFPTPERLRETCGKRYMQDGACTPADATPSVALGAREVSPLEMAGAYATFAAEGRYAEPTTIERIEDASGRVLYERKDTSRRVISRNAALGVNHVLQEVVKRGTGVRAQLDDRPVAGKTGTSQAWRDAWFAGYVPQLATVTWVGNPQPVRTIGGWEVESMTPANGYPIRVVGGSYPARIWQGVMTEAMDGKPVRDFKEAPKELFDPAKNEPVSSPDAHGVPGVVGMSVASAQIALRRAGYAVNRVYDCGGGGGMNVFKQSPGPGAAGGGSVTIWVNRPGCGGGSAGSRFERDDDDETASERIARKRRERESRR
jgi:penicillin-binding protein 1A